MSTNIPKFRFGVASFRYPALGLLSGFITYQLTTVTSVAIAAGFLIPLLVAVSITQVRIVKFKRYINKFGVPICSDEIDTEYSANLTGIVPFNDTSVACTIYVNTKGFAFGRIGTYRKLPWEEITSIRKAYYLEKPVAELSINIMHQENQLVVPWSKALNEYLPYSIHQKNF